MSMREGWGPMATPNMSDLEMVTTMQTLIELNLREDTQWVDVYTKERS